MAELVSLPETFSTIKKLWAPHLVANVNDQSMKIAKIDGQSVWHVHPNSDEMVYVLEGGLTLDLENAEPVTLKSGELYVVRKGVRHRPTGHNARVMMLSHQGTVKIDDA